MKNSLLLTFCFSGLVIGANAQITIGLSDFAAVGDTLFYGYDTTNVASDHSVTGGPNRTWNFSTSAKNEVRETNFLDPFNSPVPAPDNITHVLLDGDPEDVQFLNATTGGVETILPNPVAAFLGGEPFIRLNTLSFPATYLTRVRDTFQSRFVVPASNLGLGEIADSVRITFVVKLDNLCDGWGTLKTPSGDYAALRFKNTINIDFKFEGKKSPLPIWIPIPIGQLPLPFPSNQNNTSFIWVGNNSKYFLGEATMVTDDELTQDEFRYQTPRPVNTGVGGIVRNTMELNAYPNPASGPVTLSFNLKQAALINIDLYDVTGRVVKHFTQNCASGNNLITIDSADLPAGLYTAHLFGAGHQAVVKLKLQHK